MEEREVIILGAGVAGWAAAIYNARAELKPLILTGLQEGGQIGTTTMVDNYPGFPEGIMGPDLVNRMKEQAIKFGAEGKVDQAQELITNEDGTYTIKGMASEYKAKALIIATGASARWLGLENEEQYKSNGVHTCATCDGAFYKGKEIFIVGGGDAACEEADYLTKFASKVTMLVRGDKMRATVPMQERVERNEKIEVKYNTSITKYHGEKGLDGVTLKDNKSGEEHEEKIDGVFLAIGHTPNTQAFKGKLEMDELGYLVADKHTKTNLPGVFAAGDVADHFFRQAATAAGTGVGAAIAAERYLAARKHL